MATDKKSDKAAEKPQDEIEDAVVLSEDIAAEDPAPEESAAEESKTEEAEADAAEPAEDAPEEPGEAPEILEEPEAASGTVEEAGETGDTPEDTEDQPQDEAPEIPPVAPLPPEPVVVRKAGFFPMFLGGVVAAGIGAGAALYLFPQGLNGGNWQAAAAEAEARSAALEDRLAKLEAGPDLSPLTTQITEVQDGLSSGLTAVQSQIDTMQAKLSELEMRPITEGASKEAVAAFEAEMTRLQETMAKQRAELEEMATAAGQTEKAALMRNALTAIRIALDEGTPMTAPLAQLAEVGGEVPEGLKAVAEEGAPTRADLIGEFPEAARAALAVARASGEEEQGAGAMLNRILGARSLTPKEGSSPDAVLSRAEAAVKEGRFADALAEIETLPAPAQEKLSDWAARAQARASAKAAADALASQLNAE